MDQYWKSLGLILIGVILWIIVEKQQKDLSILLTIALCCIGSTCAISYLQPVIRFIWDLNTFINVENNLLEYLLRVVGVGFLAELIGRLCQDAGNNSASGIALFLGSSAMLYSAIPIFQEFLRLIQEILGVI